VSDLLDPAGIDALYLGYGALTEAFSRLPAEVMPRCHITLARTADDLPRFFVRFGRLESSYELTLHVVPDSAVPQGEPRTEGPSIDEELAALVTFVVEGEELGEVLPPAIRELPHVAAKLSHA
jgi:hypothetical protein